MLLVDTQTLVDPWRKIILKTLTKIANKKLVFELLVSEVKSHQMSNLVFLGVAAIRGVLAIAGIFYILKSLCTINPINAENYPKEMEMGNLSPATPGVNAEMNYPAT